MLPFWFQKRLYIIASKMMLPWLSFVLTVLMALTFSDAHGTIPLFDSNCQSFRDRINRSLQHVESSIVFHEMAGAMKLPPGLPLEAFVA